MLFLEKALAADKPYDFWFIKGGFQGLVDKSGSANIEVLLTNVIQILLFVAAVMAVIYLIYSGLLYITAAGNPDAVKKGQQGLIYAAIGIAVIVLAFFIARGVAGYVKNSVGGSAAPTTTPTTAPSSSTATPAVESSTGVPDGDGVV